MTQRMVRTDIISIARSCHPWYHDILEFEMDHEEGPIVQDKHRRRQDVPGFVLGRTPPELQATQP